MIFENPRIEQCLSAYLKNSSVAISSLPVSYSSARNFRVDVQGDQFVLRLLDSTKNSIEDLQKEIRVGQAAAERGISPQIVWVSPDSTAFIMQYIQDPLITIEESKAPENISKIAACLRKTHALPKELMAHQCHLKRMQSLYRMLQDYQLTDSLSDAAMQEVTDLYRSVVDEASLVTIHGDLTPRNAFLTKNQVLLID